MSKRVALIFRDLGAADAVAGIDHRTAENLREILDVIAPRLAPGENVLLETARYFNGYAKAYRRAKRKPEDTLFTSSRPDYDSSLLGCTVCGIYVAGSASPDLDAGHIAAHITGIGHIIRSEAEPRRKVSA